MIAGCIERMRADSCGGCERRNACAELFPAFGRLFGSGGRERPRGRDTAGSPLLSFLGEVARAIEAKAKPRERPFARRVERHIEPMLASGPVRIEEVARELGLSRQTLYRRLKAEDVTFETLLDGLRRRLALSMIGEEGLAVKEAAWRLGFSDPAAFSRAFKRWTGRSPSDLRRG